jgi:hypothetical protein
MPLKQVPRVPSWKSPVQPEALEAVAVVEEAVEEAAVVAVEVAAVDGAVQKAVEPRPLMEAQPPRAIRWIVRLMRVPPPLVSDAR